MSPQTQRRAGLYARISPTPGEGAGWRRQLDDGRALAADRGWTIAGEYVDKDTSAYRSKRRPEWQRLLADLDVGLIDAVIAYHPDRTYRILADLEQLIDTVERTGAEIATVKAGDIDLTTATGRMQARIVAAVSRHESERIGERVSRAKKQRAAEGRPAGGGRRPFGFLDDRVTLHPVEAPLLAAAAARIATGTSTYTAEADALNEAGHATSMGRQWTVGSLRRALTTPRVAGIRSYNGTIVGQAAWPAIVERGHWDRLVADREQRRRGGRPPTSTYLLRGLLECGRCHRRLYGTTTKAGTVAYRCVPHATTTGKGCGSNQILAADLEAHVLDAIRGWLTPEALDLTINQPAGNPARVARAQVELEGIDQRRADLLDRYVQGKITGDELDAAMASADDTRARLEGIVSAEPEPVAELDGTTLDKLRGDLDQDDVDAVRGVIEHLAAVPIVVAPAARKTGVPVAERVDVVPRWA